mmetsp:Transcript_4209/g.9504  ORF Transcript_4209/g.9504 Transcript_4209/m.9504 type:complete len:87 (-) Transcript_4209:356-616(-)
MLPSLSYFSMRSCSLRGQEMKEKRKRARNRLRFEVVQQARLLCPAGIPSDLDHSRTNGDPKAKPPKEVPDQRRCRHRCGRSSLRVL